MSDSNTSDTPGCAIGAGLALMFAFGLLIGFRGGWEAAEQRADRLADKRWEVYVTDNPQGVAAIRSAVLHERAARKAREGAK